MHPPWITFNFLLLLFSFTSAESESAEQKGPVNSTASRPQRETHDRERRLIPYMTYYVTQNLASPNGGVRQILLPVTSPRENLFQFGAVPKLPLNNIQNDNSQPIQVLPKPAVRLTSPTFLTPTVQVSDYKAKEGGLLPQIYRLESEVIRPRLQPQVHPQQSQSETQPLQVVKVNPVAGEQKYTVPQIIKIIPLVTKLPFKSFDQPQPHFVYREQKVHALAPHPSPVRYQNYYKEPVPSRPGNSFQESTVPVGHFSRGNAQPETVGLNRNNLGPDTNKYTIANVVFGATTLSPQEGRAARVESNGHHISIAQVSQSNPVQVSYGRYPPLNPAPSFTNEKYETATPRQQQLVYGQRGNGGLSLETEDAIQSQKPKLRVPEEEKIRFVASVTQVPVTNELESANEEQIEKNYDREPQNNLLSLLKETNKLPQNLTPDNIDSGIKTLALILERLQQQKNLYQAHKISSSTTAEPPAAIGTQTHQNPKKVHSFPEKSGTSTPGRPGIDYPTYSSIPQTNFDCSTQRYKGFFGDPDTNCQVWHYCDLNGGQASFLCPNGTIFSQVALTCDWWFNVKCASTSQLYVLNERLYKYILPFSPSFPEDYSGPVVDTYLEAKFKEMEAKAKSKALKSQENSTTTEKPEITTETQTDSPPQSAEEFSSTEA